MKNVMLVPAILLMTCAPLGGCNVIKHKIKDTFSSTSKNNINLSKEVTNSTLNTGSFKLAKSNTVVNEIITYKAPIQNNSDDTIELTASFKIDTAKSLKGDTALTLTGPGVSLIIVRNPSTNNLTATIKKNGRSKKVDINELRIDRTTTTNTELLDTNTAKLTWEELKLDSVDKTQQVTEQKHFGKTKQALPSWAIWITITVVICGFLFLYFRR